MVGILGFAWAKIREDIDPLPENSLRSRLVALLHLALLRAFALRPQLDLYFFFRLVSCKDVLVDRVLVEELCVPIFVGRCFFTVFTRSDLNHDHQKTVRVRFSLKRTDWITWKPQIGCFHGPNHLDHLFCKGSQARHAYTMTTAWKLPNQKQMDVPPVPASSCVKDLIPCAHFGLGLKFPKNSRNQINSASASSFGSSVFGSEEA